VVPDFKASERYSDCGIDMFDAMRVPLSIAAGTMSAKYASSVVTTAISKVMASIISTLLIWPKASA